ncbi:hypothetical protein BH11BAC7_BH11BAC7_30320 [soil metagenome]
MANCKFIVDFTDSIDTLIGKAKSAITAAGGNFSGNTDNGNYEISTPVGKIAGSYSVNGNSIAFEITEKPFLVSCKKIEGELRKYLGASA